MAMAKNNQINTVLLLGAGPVVIGQGTEYDYAVIQAARVLKEEGRRVIIMNSNPASLAADTQIADEVYIVPLTVDNIRMVVEREKPDALWAGYGGQSALNLLAKLKNESWVNDTLFDVSFELLDRTQNREKFREMLSAIGLPPVPGEMVSTVRDGMELGQSIGFPVLVHPSYSMAGSGSAMVYNQEELEEALNEGFDLAPSKQLVVEKALLGWEETEWELLRDHQGKTLWVATAGKVEPTGIHSQNSMTYISPDILGREKYESVLPIAESLLKMAGVVGIASLKIAHNPLTGEIRILDLNPRFTLNSALVSETLGIRIAALSAKLALGYTLDEAGAANVTQNTVVTVKTPLFDFKRFSTKNTILGPSAKAVAQTVSFGENFKEALQKAVRSHGESHPGIGADGNDWNTETARELKEKLLNPNEERLFYIYSALRKGMTLEEIHRHTKIGLPVLKELSELAAMEKELTTYALYNLPAEVLLKAKRWGYSDQQLARIFRVSEAELRKSRCRMNIMPISRPIAGSDRCCYISYEVVNDNPENPPAESAVLLVGADPINSDGLAEWGIVHAAKALKALGYRVILVSSGGLVQLETNAFDRVYIEPLTLESILNIVQLEMVKQVILQFGGASAMEFTGRLQDEGIVVLGTALEDLVEIEEPGKLQRLLDRLKIPAALPPADETSLTNRERLADAVGIVVDCVADGSECRIAGMMEQIEAAGIHPEDSALSLPAYSLDQEILERVAGMTENLINALKIQGWASLRFAVKHDIVHLLELYPWAGATTAFVCKATGIDWAAVSARVLAGQSLRDQALSNEPLKHTAVKESVFSFTRFPGMDTVLGPVKRSSGMVMGLDSDFGMAFVKSQLAAGEELPTRGRVYLSVRNEDKRAFVSIAEQLVDLGFELVASDETAAILKRNNIQCEAVYGVGEGRPNILDLMKNGQIQWVINTPSESLGKQGERLIRSTAVLRGIPIITTLSGALAAVNGLKQYIRTGITVYPLAHYFTK